MNKKCAFTLIELIISIAIFSVVAVAVYSTFSTGLVSYRKAEDFVKLSQQSRSILDRMAKDLRNSFAYSDDDTGFFGASTEISFFGLRDLSTQEGYRPQVSIVTYKFSDGFLRKLSLLGSSCFQNETAQTPQEDFSLEVKDMKFQYAYSAAASPGYEWQDAWNMGGSMPLAVKVGLTLEDGASGKTITQEKIVFNPAGGLGTTE